MNPHLAGALVANPEATLYVVWSDHEKSTPLDMNVWLSALKEKSHRFGKD